MNHILEKTDPLFIEECVTNENLAKEIVKGSSELTVYPTRAHWAVAQGIEYARIALLSPNIYNLGDERGRKVLHVIFGLYPSLVDELHVLEEKKEWLVEVDVEGISVAHVLVQYSEPHAKEIISDHHDLASIASKSPFLWKVAESALCAHENLSLWLLEDGQKELALQIKNLTERKNKSNVFYDISTRFISVADKIVQNPEIKNHQNQWGVTVEEHARSWWHSQGYTLLDEQSATHENAIEDIDILINEEELAITGSASRKGSFFNRF